MNLSKQLILFMSGETSILDDNQNVIGFGKFWALYPNREGKTQYITSEEGHEPSAEKKDFAFKVARNLNKNCFLWGGRVMVGFIDRNYRDQLHIVLIDKFDTPRAVVEFPLAWDTIKLWKIDSFEWQVNDAIRQAALIDDEVEKRFESATSKKEREGYNPKYSWN